MTTGEAIRRLRELRGVSQTKLGKAVGVTYRQIQKWEAQDKDIIESHALLKIAAFLQFPLSEFLGPLVADLEKQAGLTAEERQLVDEWNAKTEDRRSEDRRLLELDEGGRKLAEIYRKLPEAERRLLLGEAHKIGFSSGTMT